MTVDKEGIQLIKEYEAFRSNTYDDGTGVLTIGYGHTKGVSWKNVISEPMAYYMLLGELREIEHDLYKILMGVHLTQNEFNAIVSLVYNIGINGFKESTCLARLKNDDKEGAFEAFQWWNKVTINGKKVVSQGLKSRREKEVRHAGYL